MDAIIIENENLAADWAKGQTLLIEKESPKSVPKGVHARADQEALDEVRSVKDLASVDIVITTRKPDGTPAVLLSRRKPSDPFGGYWWVYGGSLGAYTGINEFIAKRAEDECGVPAEPQALIGVYRTSASDFPQSTLQPCYATVVAYEAIEAKMRTDQNHETVQLFTSADLDALPQHEEHWYPMRVARLALTNIP